jgi:hypothetical protein
MKKLLVTGLFLVLATGAFAYLYDGLNTNDCIYAPGVADSLHARAGFYYYGLLNKYYDAEGESQDDYAEGVDGSNYAMLIPIDVGYNFNGVAQLDIGLQLINWSNDTGVAGADKEGEFGLGDLWVKARGIFQVGPEWYLGPRLGFKAAIGDIEKGLGDDQHDVDLGVWVSKARLGNNFRAKANLGFRYRLARTVEVAGAADLEVTPGMMIYARIEPGFAITPEFEAYGIIDFVNAFASKTDGNEDVDSESMGLSVGVRPTYFIDGNNAVSAEVQYPVMGDNIDQELLFGFNYEGYIPF